MCVLIVKKHQKNGDFNIYFMFIEIAQAGIIDEAPSIYELLIRVIKMILNFVGALAALGMIGSGTIYVMSSGNREQQKFAKTVLTGSVVGLVIILVSLVVVSSVAKLF